MTQERTLYMGFIKCLLGLILFISISGNKAIAQTAEDTARAARYGDTADDRMKNHDYNGAVAYYTKQIRTPLRVASFYYNRAAAESFLKSYDHAAADYDSALRLDSTLALAYMNQAFMYMQLNKTKEAFAGYEKGIKMVKDSQSMSNMYISRGNAYVAINKYPEAEADFTTGITYNPYSWQAWYQRGSVRRKLKKLKPALEDLNRGNVLKQNFPDLILVRGITKFELDMYKAAVEDLSAALKLKKSTDGYYFRGLALLKQGEDSLAREDFNTILATDKNNLSALNSRAEANFKMKHPRLAIKDYNTIITQAPNSGEAYANRAYVYTQMKDYNKACVDWHKAKDLGITRAQEAIKKFCKGK